MEELKKFIENKILPIHSKSGYEYNERYWKNHFPKELQQLKSLTSFLDEYYPKVYIKQRIWHILNNKLELQYCPVCKKNLLKWNQYNYREYCSLKCQGKSQKVKEKRKQTNLKKYGVENTFELVEPQNKDYKAISLKREQTLLKKYGVKAYSQTLEWKEKIKQTNLEKYGVEHLMHDENFKNKIIEKIKNNPERIKKIKQTNLEKYGVEFPLQNKEIRNKGKQTTLKKYGVNNIAQKHIKHYDEYKNLTKEKIIQNFVDKEGLFKNKEFQEYFGISYSYLQKIKKKFNLDEFPNKFNLEFELFDWIPIKDKIRNDRTQIYPYELDIFIPSKNLAIEFNGIYWHSIKFKKRNYHQKKTLKCLDKNIQLLQIFENEWLDETKRRIWKSIILYHLGLLRKKYYAKNLTIKEITSKQAKDFLENNHLQGYIPAKVKIGLFENNKLISLMTFSKPRFNKNYEWELIRFASKKYSICVGCASKLFKYFVKNYNPQSIISYGNLRWSNGGLYKILGFNFKEITEPNYFYINSLSGKIVGSRMKFQKHKLKEILENFDENKTEIENMYQNGFYPIFDSGSLKFDILFFK